MYDFIHEGTHFSTTGVRSTYGRTARVRKDLGIFERCGTRSLLSQLRTGSGPPPPTPGGRDDDDPETVQPTLHSIKLTVRTVTPSLSHVTSRRNYPRVALFDTLLHRRSPLTSRRARLGLLRLFELCTVHSSQTPRWMSLGSPRPSVFTFLSVYYSEGVYVGKVPKSGRVLLIWGPAP